MLQINSVILKEKSIKVESLVPSSKMHINMHRNNFMPDKIDGGNFNCIIEYEVNLQDEQNKNLVAMKISYLIIVTTDENYEQESVANRLFDALVSMYIKNVNDLLHEANYPPVLLGIVCK